MLPKFKINTCKSWAEKFLNHKLPLFRAALELEIKIWVAFKVELISWASQWKTLSSKTKPIPLRLPSSVRTSKSFWNLLRKKKMAPSTSLNPLLLVALQLTLKFLLRAWRTCAFKCLRLPSANLSFKPFQRWLLTYNLKIVDQKSPPLRKSSASSDNNSAS